MATIDIFVTSKNLENSNLVADANRDYTLNGSLISDTLTFKSGNGSDIFEMYGNQTAKFSGSGKNIYFDPSNLSWITTGTGSGNATIRKFMFNTCGLSTPFNSNSQNIYSIGSAYIGVGQVGNGGRKISIKIGNEPTTNISDVFDHFAKDGGIAGNASPWWKTENGDKFGLWSIGGWGDPTGTLTRSTFDTSTVTLSELAERVAAIINDFRNEYQIFKA